MEKTLYNKIANLKQKYEPEGLIILGVFESFARGDETADSDVDILYTCAEKTLKRIQDGIFMFFLKVLKKTVSCSWVKKSIWQSVKDLIKSVKNLYFRRFSMSYKSDQARLEFIRTMIDDIEMVIERHDGVENALADRRAIMH